MTLGENKKIALGLIEEYSNTNINLTDDTDIATRLNFLYATAYQELSQIKKILKTIILKEITGNVSEGYTEYKLPDDMYQFKMLIGLDSNNKNVNVLFKIIGKDIILISNEVDSKVILEYYAYPTVITEETQNDFELELDQDAQLVLPYAVANDVLKVDPSSDYTAFYAEYKRKLELLDTRITTPTATIEEGIL